MFSGLCGFWWQILSHSSPVYIYTCRRHKKCGFDPWVRKIPWGQGMATHSSILAWAIPWTEQSIGSQRIRVDWSNLACMCVCVYIYIYIFSQLFTNEPLGKPLIWYVTYIWLLSRIFHHISFSTDYDVFRHNFHFVYPVCGLLSFLHLQIHIFHQI